MSIKEDLERLDNIKNIRFDELLAIATRHFGHPRNDGSSHHVFRMPWVGKPWVNLQRDKHDKKMAKPYQVRQVRTALRKLEEGRHEK